jgi:hypothetical protein
MYINEDSKGNKLPDVGKADALIADGAREVTAEWQPNLIGVVHNEHPDSDIPPFDAAAFAFDQREFERMTRSWDHRPKRWLVHPHAAKLAR